jgi:hypothetical protein
MQMPGNQPLGGNSNAGVIAKAGELRPKRFLAEPGALALGVPAWGVGNRFHSNSERDGTFEVRTQLALCDEVGLLGVHWNAASGKAGNLFEPVANVHPMNAPLVAIVEHGAVILTHIYTHTTRGS